MLLTESNKIKLKQRRRNDSISTTKSLKILKWYQREYLPRTLVSDDKERNICFVRIKLSTQHSLLLIDIIRIHIYEQNKQFSFILVTPKVLLQCMPSQISANNGPCYLLTSKRILDLCRKKKSVRKTKEDRNDMSSFKIENKMLRQKRQFWFVRESFLIHWYLIDSYFLVRISILLLYPIPSASSSNSFIPILIEYKFAWIQLSHSRQLMIRRKPQRAWPTKWNFNAKKEIRTKGIRSLMSSFLLNPFTTTPPHTLPPSCPPLSSKVKWYKNKKVKRDGII